MNDFLGRVTSEQGFFEKILSKVPGFSGYIDLSNRRIADKLLRDTLANHFESLWQKISSIQRELITSGELEKVTDLEGAALKIRQFIDRVKSAAYGYAGFFDAVKIKQEELSSIYQYDLKMLDLEGDISRAIDNVESSLGTDGLPASLRNLISLSQQCLDSFEKRKEAIMNSVGGSGVNPPESSSAS
jgi:hypothetical protein